MKKKTFIGIIVILLIAMIPISQHLQAQKKDNPDKKKGNEPKVDIKVNKKTDGNGNVVQYDSTYTWSWSNDGKMMPAEADSMFRKMQQQFSFNFNFDNDPFFKGDFPQMSPALKDSSNGSLSPNDFNFDMPGDLNKMLQEHQKMMEQFFNHKPAIITTPDNSNNPPAQKQEAPKAQKSNQDNQKQEINNVEKIIDEAPPVKTI